MASRGYALLLLRNRSGQFLLQLRTDDAPTFPNCWGFFGGAIEGGEDPRQAVIREAREELHYQCRDPQLLCSIDSDKLVYPVKGWRFYFTEEFDDAQDLRLGEGKGMGWYWLEEMKDLRLAPHNLQVIQILEHALTSAAG